MPISQSRSASLWIAIACSIFCVSALHAQEVPNEPATANTDDMPADARDLFLEVFINDASMKMIGNFKQQPDGSLKASAGELREVGIKPPAGAADDELIELDKLPDLSYRVDAQNQQIYVTTTNSGRAARIINIGKNQRNDIPEPQSGYGSVLNYSLFASSNSLGDSDAGLFQGISGSFDARVFSPYGALSQSFIAGYSDGSLDGITRLNTTWSYSDPKKLITYRVGDFTTGGLSWTRPVYFGGIQAQRNFALRSDLVTEPLPAFEGTAAVPSTREIYTQNVRSYSGDVPAGPYQVTNLPVFSGAGEARVVLRDSLGRETTATLPFYSSNRLLRQGLHDFSVEIGAPRRNFGIESSDYDGRIMGVATARYGLTDWLTLESHFEGGANLLNGGIGAAFPIGAWGVASAAVAGSSSGSRSGALFNATLEMSYNDWSIYTRMQRAFDNYDDIASVTAEPTSNGSGQFTVLSAGVPRAIDQITLSVPAPLDLSSLNLSYTRFENADGRKSQIAGLSYSQTFKRASFYATAFADLDDRKSFGIFAGLSIPFGNNISASTGIESGPDGFNVVADISKSEQPEDGSIGWRARTSEGKDANRQASMSYRAPFARFEAGVQQYDGNVRATGQMDGAIAVAGGDIFTSTRIDDAFAVVDVGTPGVEVQQQNRRVGKTNNSGRILVPNLNSYEPNTVSIDPKNLPIDADVPATKEVVVPAARSGVVVKFGVSETPKAALITITDKNGVPLQAGLNGKLQGTSEEFVTGYDGQVYLRGLGARNAIDISLQDGSTCHAEFPYKPQPGKQVVINDVRCL
ncbi:fimbria/pilus outer membrane usher protein [Rhizobium rhizogenes]|uniref:fimbria/pilus outer membrane usher protein n=1 Tax=Rhizobium rhizogenes TaxID=359 RepID=UPI00157255B3|nr:fimbria/pilus outer membrane usher protein [Rhizobium rhizogenes]NTH21030.1 fimbrial biogenesis outer membrane usher protein [Rhizobium rhizogenes]NTH34039.1 fimbrial biogenesis outer membrane usher protein [Rhizobium rhizogenes]